MLQDAAGTLVAGWREGTTDQGHNFAQFSTNNNYGSIKYTDTSFLSGHHVRNFFFVEVINWEKNFFNLCLFDVIL